jgi:hypothetical protein
MKVNKERIIAGSAALAGCFNLALVAFIKFSPEVAMAVLAAVSPIVTLIVNFYFRKSPTAESETKTNGGTK